MAARPVTTVAQLVKRKLAAAAPLVISMRQALCNGSTSMATSRCACHSGYQLPTLIQHGGRIVDA